MLQAETIQPEPLDDRNIAKLEELFDAPSAPEPEYKVKIGLGDLALLEDIDKILGDAELDSRPAEHGPGQKMLRPTSKFGHAVLSTKHIEWPMISHS